MAKKQKCPEFENHERWLVSYADMVTLLFAVFVVLFALKEGGDKKHHKTAGSMQESFNTPLEEIPLDRRAGPDTQGFGIFENHIGDQLRPPIVKRFLSEKEKILTIDADQKKTQMELEERLYGPDKFRQSKDPGSARIVSLEKTPQGFKIKMLARHFFNPGEQRIRRKALKELDDIVTVVKALDRNVTVEGHTDSIPMQGEYTNWELSTLRATNVLRYMIEKHRFSPEKLSAAGYADTRPVAHNGSEAGRQLNRRIELNIHYDDINEQAPP